MGRRTIIIGDVRGCLAEFKEMMSLIRLQFDDRLIVMNANKSVAQYAATMGAQLLLGQVRIEEFTHDDMPWMVKHNAGSREWWRKWTGPKSVVFGHTIVSKLVPLRYKGTVATVRCYGIDTGCATGGQLSAVAFTDGHVPQWFAVPGRTVAKWEAGEVKWSRPIPTFNAYVLVREGDTVGGWAEDSEYPGWPYRAWFRQHPRGMHFDTEERAERWVEAMAYIAAAQEASDLLLNSKAGEYNA